MKKLVMALACVMIIVSCFIFNVFAEDNREKETVTTQQILDKQDFEGYFDKQQDEEDAKDNVALFWYGKIRQGIDNNVYLDPTRKTDGFFETGFGEYMTYYHSEDQRVNLDSSFTSVLYYNQNNNNFVNIYLNPWVEQDIYDDLLTVEGGYVFDWVCFPNSPDGTYIDNGFSAYLRHNFTPDFYHKIGGKIDIKSYIHDRKYNGAKVVVDEKRHDAVYTLGYHAAWFLWDRVKIRQRLRVFFNDSNYQYQDYYDYWGYDTKTTAVLYFTKKFYSIVNFLYTKKIYYSRTVPDDTANQRDGLYVASFLLAYDITPSLTISGDYSYRENTSNQPFERYSGSIYTVTLTYAF